MHALLVYYIILFIYDLPCIGLLFFKISKDAVKKRLLASHLVMVLNHLMSNLTRQKWKLSIQCFG